MCSTLRSIGNIVILGIIWSKGRTKENTRVWNVISLFRKTSHIAYHRTFLPCMLYLAPLSKSLIYTICFLGDFCIYQWPHRSPKYPLLLVPWPDLRVYMPVHLAWSFSIVWPRRAKLSKAFTSVPAILLIVQAQNFQLHSKNHSAYLFCDKLGIRIMRRWATEIPRLQVRFPVNSHL